MLSRENVNDKIINELTQAVAVLTNKVHAPSNMHLSIANIDSIADDRTTCNITMNNMMSQKNVRSIIPCETLNVTNHLVENDTVLVMHSLPLSNDTCIISRVNNSTTNSSDQAMVVTNKLDFSKLII